MFAVDAAQPGHLAGIQLQGAQRCKYFLEDQALHHRHLMSSLDSGRDRHERAKFA